jgi:hypothetical protein
MKYAYARIDMDTVDGLPQWTARHRVTGEVFSLTRHRLHRPGAEGAAVTHPDSELEIMIRYEEGSKEAQAVDPSTIHEIIGTT